MREFLKGTAAGAFTAALVGAFMPEAFEGGIYYAAAIIMGFGLISGLGFDVGIKNAYNSEIYSLMAAALIGMGNAESYGKAAAMVCAALYIVLKAGKNALAYASAAAGAAVGFIARALMLEWVWAVSVFLGGALLYDVCGELVPEGIKPERAFGAVLGFMASAFLCAFVMA